MISIIIPAYNEEKYLEKTLKSIHEQTTDDYETIVVANGCTDNTEKIAQRYADRTFSINKPNVSLARNIGAFHAKGDVLLFLDADTRLAPNAITEIKSQFRQKHAVATLLGRPDQQKIHYLLLSFFQNLIHSVHIYEGSSAGNIITHAYHFKKVGGFNKNLRIRENRALIISLKRYGKYLTIKNTRAIISTRRYNHWGLVRTTLFWLRHRWKPSKSVKYDAIR
jgi:glycosyltransferase involved in cell wall biosynthesis